MPFYKFKNLNTNEEYEELMGISEMESFLKENPHIVQGYNLESVFLHSGRGLKKPDIAFREILKETKKKNSRGLTRSTINTF